ncbi:diguanylate cyclase, partial [Klebsiella pneumoniae]
IASESHPLGADIEIPLTVSIGISASQGPQDSVDNMVRRADTALYLAKKQGRNCCIKEATEQP